MSENIVFEAIKPNNIEDVINLTKNWIREDIYPYTIFSCKGYSRYIECLINLPENFRAQRFGCVYIDNQLAGYAEWRYSDSIIFLNNIGVIENYRGMGIGNYILRKLMSFGLEKGMSYMELDVFEWNINAMRWYESKGFANVSEKHWLDFQIVNPIEPLGDVKCDLLDYPQSQAVQELYGFSSVRMVVEGEMYEIGRIGQQYYRLTNINMMNNSELLQCLTSLEPRRSFLVYSGDDINYRGNEKKIRKVTSTIRMRCPLKVIN